MLGMYNSYLKSDGYDVDATANKKIQADFPEIEGIEWLYDSQVKDYENLLKRRRDKMTQTFRYMLRQNDITNGSTHSSKKDDDEDDDDDDDKPSPEKQLLDDVATVARIGGKAIYHTGRALGQTIQTGIDAYNWLNEEDDEDEERNAFASRSIREPEPPIDEEIFEQTQGLMRRGASRSRSRSASRASGEASPSPQGEEQASGSNQPMRLLRRGASRSRSASRASGEASRSATPPKKNPKK